jgi:hypothetical protein
MAHFFKPDFEAPVGYDVDSKEAPGSVWRMQIHVGATKTIAFGGGIGWFVRSNNPGVVPNDRFSEKVKGDIRLLTLTGSSNGTSLLEAGTGGTVWICLQVLVGDVEAKPGPTLAHPGSTGFPTVWAVDGNHGLWNALTWVDQGMKGLRSTVQVFSLTDLITVCAKYTIHHSQTIDYLAIFGHGTGGYQSVGGGNIVEASGTRSIVYRGIVLPGDSHLNGPAATILTGLNGVLSRDATVLLGGCNVGEGSMGDGLLTTLSVLLRGRTVQAFENKVYYWTGHMSGSLKKARGLTVTSSYHDLITGSPLPLPF